MWIIAESTLTEGDFSVAAALREGETVVGRGPDCDLVVLDARLSKRHLTLTYEEGAVRFRDLGSSGGTLLNGKPASEGLLREGDRLEAGATRLRLVGALPRSVPAAIPRGARPRADAGLVEGAFESLRRAETPPEILGRLLALLIGLFQARRGFVLLQEKAGGELVPVASHAIDDARDFAAVSTTIYRRALDEGGLVFIEDTRLDDACRRSATFAGVDRASSVLCCPLRAQGDPFGVVYLDMPCVEGLIPYRQIELLEAVTGLAAERLAADRVRESLINARKRIETLNRLAWEGERLVHGKGEAAERLKREIAAAASKDTSVLIFGETGTGKEMVARTLHRLSERRDGPFVPVNCAALPPDLIDAELFGYERGAFTGAAKQHKGRFELATGGTLFLDEVGELPAAVQVKLLRVLQERTLTRLGGSDEIALDFRLLCATNRDLEKAVREGRFRKDFFFRINVFRIDLVPLRDRPEDIMPLARHFLDALSKRFGKKLSGFTAKAETALGRHGWPGNIRELKNAVERAVVVESGERIRPESLPLSLDILPGEGSPFGDLASLPAEYTGARESFERAFLEHALRKNRGNIAAVVRETGLARPTVYRWLTKFGINAKDF